MYTKVVNSQNTVNNVGSDARIINIEYTHDNVQVVRSKLYDAKVNYKHSGSDESLFSIADWYLVDVRETVKYDYGSISNDASVSQDWGDL